MNEANEVVPRARKEIKLSPADEARFWSKVDKSGGPDACWLWTARKAKTGYGNFKVGGEMTRAHRVSWTITNGPIPHDGSYHGICVCHKCDVKLCCNPSHLFLGTNADNVADRGAKGRTASGDKSGARTHPERLAKGNANGARTKPERLARGDKHGSRTKPECWPRGDAHGMSKLTSVQVIEIRALYALGAITKKSLSEMFGISTSTTGRIINGKLWKHC
jgi:hypothetical protein